MAGIVVAPDAARITDPHGQAAGLVEDVGERQRRAVQTAPGTVTQREAGKKERRVIQRIRPLGPGVEISSRGLRAPDYGVSLAAFTEHGVDDLLEELERECAGERRVPHDDERRGSPDADLPCQSAVCLQPP